MRNVFLLFLLLVTLTASAQRERINLDSDWRFHFGHAADAQKDFNYSIAPIFSKSGKAETTAIDPRFDDSQWRALNLPHDWAVELPFVFSPNFDVQSHGYKPVGGLYPETSIGWYRKKFDVIPADSGRRFSITFDGVFRNSSVWINGFYLGTNASGYIGVEYDITDYLLFDRPNVLVVRVDASQYEGWFYEGAGIYRHVWLNKYHNLHVAAGDVVAYADVQGNDARVSVTTTITNDDLIQQRGKLTTYVTDRQGKLMGEMQHRDISVKPGSHVTVTQSIPIKDAVLWSLENPYLYRIHTVITIRESETERKSFRFGVREISLDNQHQLLLNGKPVKIQGVNCHQDHAGVGSALPDYLQYYRVRLLKEMGVNSYRASHHAPTPELLDACDSLGMLVLDETRLTNSSPEYMDQLARLIRRDRNHASVFMWSIGNEEGYIQKNSIGKRLALSMMARLHQLDSTRLCTYAADMGNEYNGINEVIPVRGFNYREKFVIPYHQDHPSQPIVGTEMGSTVTTRGIYEVDSVRAYLTDQDIHAPWWASTAEAWWPIAADNPWFMGGYIWTGFDYRGEPTPFKWPNINSHFGIMDVCGFPKNLYYYYQSWWTSKDVLHISPHWNWAGKEGQPIEVWVNSNADEVELLLNGKSLGRKKMPRNSHLTWQVPYKPGKLEAIGWKGKRKFSTAIETTGKPARIVLRADRTALAADGRDASVVNVVVLDAKGREVPDAGNLIRFTVQGSGKAIGVGNGDPSSHEPDNFPEQSQYQRRLFNGRAQLIVQSSPRTGVLSIEAQGEGLTGVVIVIPVR
jgi:beta-galactosidase